MPADPFTVNKQKVRELNLHLIERHFASCKGQLRYLGLPAESLRDILLWQDYFVYFAAVERGKPNEEYILQHNIELNAMKYGISDKLHLLRGDMDTILLNGRDEYGNLVEYPFDVVVLDYSGGVIYKNASGRSARTESIAEMIRNQAQHDQDFLLFIWCNLDNEDHGEIRRVFADIQRELVKLGVDVESTVAAYLAHEREEARLKVYVPYLIRNLGSPKYQTEAFKPVFYLGNRNTRMMNFSLWMERTVGYTAGRPSRQTLVHLLNLRAFECVGGQVQETDFGICPAGAG
jgi:hypothetical protein